MRKSRAFMFIFLILALLYSIAPSNISAITIELPEAATETLVTAGAQTDGRMTRKDVSSDPGMLIPGNTAIDPEMLIPGNSDIDPEMLIQPDEIIKKNK